MARLHFHALTVAEIRRETADAISIAFDIPSALKAAFAYAPGQYLTLRHHVGEEEIHRSYSLCSALADDEWRIGIREIPQGVFSTWANHRLKVGDTLECMAPDGRFCPVIDPKATTHYVLFAVGSGITPCLSIAKTVLATAPFAQVTLVYGNRRASSTMFREDLADLKNRYLARFDLHCVFSREPPDIPLYHGRVDGAKVQHFLQTLIPAASIDQAFLCGPTAMLNEVEAELRAAGVVEDKIHVERFGVGELGALTRDEVETKSDAKVEVIIDGVRREISIHESHASILDAARAAGLDLPFSCKSGVCATCRARVLEGKVHMTRNFALLKADLEAGVVLSCQARPLTDRVVLSFDDR